MRNCLPAVILGLCFSPLGSGAGFCANCPGGATVYSGSTVSCSSSSGSASASLNRTDPLHAGVSASASYFSSGSPPSYPYGVSAGAGIESELTFVIVGGSGAGYYTPCLSGSADRRNGSFVAQFGTVNVPQVSPFGGLCALGFTSYAYMIPFVFGVPQTQRLNLGATAAVYDSGFASASAGLNGFVIWSMQGQQIADANATLVPEPRTFVPILLLLACGLWRRRAS
jgi:hypothetical protein